MQRSDIFEVSYCTVALCLTLRDLQALECGPYSSMEACTALNMKGLEATDILMNVLVTAPAMICIWKAVLQAAATGKGVPGPGKGCSASSDSGVYTHVPPRTGPCSKTVTLCPSASSSLAAAKPAAPAPTTACGIMSVHQGPPPIGCAPLFADLQTSLAAMSRQNVDTKCLAAVKSLCCAGFISSRPECH